MGPGLTRCAPTCFLLLFAACAASSPALPRELTVANGRRVRVSLIDVTGKRTLSVQNLSSGSRDSVYGDTGGDGQVKVVDDERLQQLLDALAATGMFRAAAAAPQPGARAAIAVETPDQRLVWSRPVPTTANLEEVKHFEEGRSYVLAVYNAETAFHRGSLDSFPPETRARMERAQQAANDKAKDQQGPPR